MKTQLQSDSEMPTLFVGLDVHKDSVDVATAAQGRAGEIRHVGSVGGDLGAVMRVLRRLISAGERLHVVYEGAPAALFCNAPCASTG